MDSQVDSEKRKKRRKKKKVLSSHWLYLFWAPSLNSWLVDESASAQVEEFPAIACTLNVAYS